MTTTASRPDAGTPTDGQLKGRHRAMWASGDYATVARELVWPLGAELVRACGIGAGDRVLDVAAGTGNAAIQAAATGATVVASDLTPELIAAGRAEAAAAGVDLDWREADAESLPFADASFDVVMSAIGVMFAPHHQSAADELIRVCRPGGRLGLVAWTPDGLVGQMLAAIRPFVPSPPPGTQPPPLWGEEAHVRELFGDRVRDLAVRTALLRVDRFTDARVFAEYFKTNYGPTIAAYAGLGADAARVAQLDAALTAVGERFGAGTGRFDWEYLVVTAQRAG